MIATKPQPPSVMGFKYLKPIQIERKSSRKGNRLLNYAFGLIYGGTLCATAWFSSVQVKQTASPIPSPPAERSLWDTLGSPEFATWQEGYQIERRAALLKAAEADREIARDYKVLASQSIAAALLPHAPGEQVVTTTKVSVSCFDEGDAGWTAVLTQMDESSPFEKVGTVATLEECYAGTREAGGAFGKAGKYQPTIPD